MGTLKVDMRENNLSRIQRPEEKLLGSAGGLSRCKGCAGMMGKCDEGKPKGLKA